MYFIFIYFSIQLRGTEKPQTVNGIHILKRDLVILMHKGKGSIFSVLFVTICKKYGREEREREREQERELNNSFPRKF